MPKTIFQLSQEISDLSSKTEKGIEKLDSKLEKLDGRVDDYLVSRLVPTEHRVNQVHGFGKWVGSTTVVLLLTLCGFGAKLMYDLGKLESKFEKYTTTAFAEKIEDKIEAGNYSSIPKVVKTLKDKGIRLNPNDVGKLAERTVRDRTDAAWGAALALVSYQSTITPAERGKPSGSPAAQTHYRIPKAPGRESEEGPELIAYWGTSDENAKAIIEAFGDNLNAGAKYFPKLLEARGGVVSLDGLDIRNVVFLNAEIVYNGGRVRLEAVRFVNCKFTFSRSPASETMLVALASPSETKTVKVSSL